MIKSWKHQIHSQNWKHKRLQVFWRMMSPQHLTRRPHWQNLTLSKQKTLILPQKLILGGLIQKILDFLSRFWAYTVPTVMAAGKAGGTTTVTMSNTRRIVFPAGSWRKKDPFEPRKVTSTLQRGFNFKLYGTMNRIAPIKDSENSAWDPERIAPMKDFNKSISHECLEYLNSC